MNDVKTITIDDYTQSVVERFKRLVKLENDLYLIVEREIESTDTGLVIKQRLAEAHADRLNALMQNILTTAQFDKTSSKLSEAIDELLKAATG